MVLPCGGEFDDGVELSRECRKAPFGPLKRKRKILIELYGVCFRSLYVPRVPTTVECVEQGSVAPLDASEQTLDELFELSATNPLGSLRPSCGLLNVSKRYRLAGPHENRRSTSLSQGAPEALMLPVW